MMERLSFSVRLADCFIKSFLTLLEMPVVSNYPLMTGKRREEILAMVKPGDIILETHNSYPGWQLLEKITGNSDFTHMSIYEGGGKLIEAVTGHPSGMGVARTELAEYLRGRIAIKVIRPLYASEEDIASALSYAVSQIGKPYDGAFDFDDNSCVYCSELIAKALSSMPNAVKVEMHELFGRKFLLPDHFLSIENLQIIYDDGSNFWKNQLSHYPALLGGLAVSLLFVKSGPAAMLLSFLCGTLVTAFTGGRLQWNAFEKYRRKSI